ncbi:hypothetical protein JVT61DRAFT_2077 [Boletus reticuloceps]|uniref:Uncharacterized protein n=1 Tax=Boletus reticuloceps TaxID=495285 RepID=A0A8I2YPN7_9AGAM|nr:hypothetical protein JVT61DRAFT_2077 [Boletus reticuloceps]
MERFDELPQVTRLAQRIHSARSHHGLWTGGWGPTKRLLLMVGMKSKCLSGISNVLSSHDQTALQPLQAARSEKKLKPCFPGEVWRAKNVANDYLGLRQPIHNTCLTYMSSSSSSHQTQILAGTRFGDLRRYDTRSGRRPVSDFKGVGKVGGVKSVENGSLEQ